jgi:Zn-dependent protease with chaperone function
MLLRGWLIVICFVCPLFVAGCSRQTTAERAANEYAAREIAAAPVHGNLPDYSLPADKLAKARHLTTVYTALHFSSLAWGIVQLILLLSLGAVAWMGDRAVALSRARWLQAYVFVFLLLLARTILNLPFGLYGHHLALVYNFSVQGWGGWFVDLGKSFLLNSLLYGALALLLFWLIGRYPKRWWLAFWLAAIPITLALVYLNPIAIDPLFYKFEPLALHHPELSAQLEHMGVPPARQFLMEASAKVTTPNAYVTGLGGSKRIVVWDTSLSPGQSVSPGVLWMVGHECGHYALGHLRIGILLSLVSLPLALYLAYRFLNAMLTRFGARWRIPRQQDWGAVAILLLGWAVLNVVQEPISNTVSRQIEHNADIYGQEAIHGLVPDPQRAAKDEMDADGLRALSDPNPGRFIELWMFNHPATGRRAAFAKAYDPWAPGMEPKYFKR